MHALIQVVQQKLLSALAEAEELDHVYMCRLVQAVAELAPTQKIQATPRRA